MGPQEDYIETVFTCEGNIDDPDLQLRLDNFRSRLKDLLLTDKRKVILRKVEPWNSVKVTFNIPRDAAQRLKLLAQQGDATLRQLGVLAVQIEGDRSIALTIQGKNNETAQLVFRTGNDISTRPSFPVADTGGGPSISNLQSAQRNIADLVQQNSSLNLLGPLFNPQTMSQASGIASEHSTLLGDSSAANVVSQIIHSVTNTPGFPPRSVQEVNSMGHLPHTSDISHPLRLPPSSTSLSSIPGESSAELPPPPPYPHGSSFLNNIAKNARFGQQGTPSPLLVNLLQNEPSLANNLNNFIHTKMLPPPQASPPPKKKRKPRKPKEKKGSESSAPSSSVTSEESGKLPSSAPVEMGSSFSVPLATSGGSSNMPSIPMVTQALPANTTPVVTYSSQGRHSTNVLTSHSSYTDYLSSTAHSTSKPSEVPASNAGFGFPQHMPEVEFHGTKDRDITQYLPENTAGKIINPYTGHLEPVDVSSDTSPNKSESSSDSFSPVKRNKTSPIDRKPHMLHREVSNPANGELHKDTTVSSTCSTVSSVAQGEQMYPQDHFCSSTGTNREQLNLNPVFTQSSMSGPRPRFFQQKQDSSSMASMSAFSSKQTFNGQYDMISKQRYASQQSLSSSIDLSGMRPNTSMNSTKPEFIPLHQSLYKSMTESELAEEKRSAASCVPTRSNYDMVNTLPHLQKSQKTAISSTSLAQSEHLLNKPLMSVSSKTVSSLASRNGCALDSPGGDSENSSQSSLVPDHSLGVEISTTVSVLESETKIYNHDSGVGSSSERSEGTPSEPGDDFKVNHLNSEEFMHLKNCSESVSKASSSSTSNANEITVGFALTNSTMSSDPYRKNTDISTIMSMDKVLNHTDLGHYKGPIDASSMKKAKHNNFDHVTVLHWSTKDKIISNQVDNHKQKSPKQFLRDELVPPPRMTERQASHNTDFVNVKMDSSQPQVVECKNPFDEHQPSIANFSTSMTSVCNSQINISSWKSESRRSPFSSLKMEDMARSSSGNHISNHMLNKEISSSWAPSSGEGFSLCNNKTALDSTLASSISSSVPGKATTVSSANGPMYGMIGINLPSSVSSVTIGPSKVSLSDPCEKIVNNTNSALNQRLHTSVETQKMMSASCSSTEHTTVVSNHQVSESFSKDIDVTVVSSTGPIPKSSPQGTETSKTVSKRKSPANSMIKGNQSFFDTSLPLAKRLTESVQKVVKPLPSSIDMSVSHIAQLKSSTKSSSSDGSPPRPNRLPTAEASRALITAETVMVESVQISSSGISDTVKESRTEVMCQLESASVPEVHNDALPVSEFDNQVTLPSPTLPFSSAVAHGNINKLPDSSTTLSVDKEKLAVNTTVVSQGLLFGDESGNDTPPKLCKILPTSGSNGSLSSCGANLGSVDSSSGDNSTPPLLSCVNDGLSSQNNLTSKNNTPANSCAKTSSVLMNPETSSGGGTELVTCTSSQPSAPVSVSVLSSESNNTSGLKQGDGKENSENMKPQIIESESKHASSKMSQQGVDEMSGKVSTNAEESVKNVSLRNLPKKNAENCDVSGAHAQSARSTRQRTNTMDSVEDISPKNISLELESTKLGMRASARKRKAVNDTDIHVQEPPSKRIAEEGEANKLVRSTDLKDHGKKGEKVISGGHESNHEGPKSGLRNRLQNKPLLEESTLRGKLQGKNTLLEKHGMKKKSEEDLPIKKTQPNNRRNRQSPSPTQEKQHQGSRDRSPARKARNALPPPAAPGPVENVEEKRSTRSSKPKDATDTLPPTSKRRRSSRDHR